MFICVNTISLLFIGASYIKMLRAIRQTSAEAMRPTLSGRENVVARRFAVIVVTDCACWLPIIVVKMAALAGEDSNYSVQPPLPLPIEEVWHCVTVSITSISSFISVATQGNSLTSSQGNHGGLLQCGAVKV